MSKQIQITKNELVEGWSLEAADFINKLLQRKPVNRLGTRGPQEVKDHPWFRNFPWKDLYEKKMQTQFIPKAGDNFDQKYCQAPEKIGQNTKENYDNLIRRETVQNLFRNFTFISYEEENSKQANNIQNKKPVDNNTKKLNNPHSNLSSSVESTRTTKPNEKGFPHIEKKKPFNYSNVSNSSQRNLINSSSKNNLINSSSKSNLVFKVLKKSSSAVNYNYIKNKPKTGISSYYFQN